MPILRTSTSDRSAPPRAGRPSRDIAEVLTASVRLIDYVRRNYKSLEEHVGTGRRDYTVLVAISSQRGLVDRYGKPPSPATIARTWAAVTTEREQAAEWKHALRQRAPSTTARAPPPTSRAAPPPARAPPPDRGRAKPDPEAPAETEPGASSGSVDAAFAQAEARRAARSFEG